MSLRVSNIPVGLLSITFSYLFPYTLCPITIKKKIPKIFKILKYLFIPVRAI